MARNKMYTSITFKTIYYPKSVSKGPKLKKTKKNKKTCLTIIQHKSLRPIRNQYIKKL